MMSGRDPSSGAVRRVAVFSMHTSPLAQPGAGDGGGMNVYVRALASALARAGVECDVYTRAEDPKQSPVVEVEPGFRVVHVNAGPQAPIPRYELPALVDPFIDETSRILDASEPVEVLHANYWLSGAVRTTQAPPRSSDGRNLPHPCAGRPTRASTTTLTSARVPSKRDRASDLMLAPTMERIELVALRRGPERVEVAAVSTTPVFFLSDRAWKPFWVSTVAGMFAVAFTAEGRRPLCAAR
jgi:D-inositol-3-phosphate glycosyltransferase